jgi:predicted dehydrogenase
LKGLADRNRLRTEAVRTAIGVTASVYADFAAMLRELHPELVFVCTRDARPRPLHRRRLERRLGAAAIHAIV